MNYCKCLYFRLISIPMHTVIFYSHNVSILMELHVVSLVVCCQDDNILTIYSAAVTLDEC